MEKFPDLDTTTPPGDGSSLGVPNGTATRAPLRRDASHPKGIKWSSASSSSGSVGGWHGRQKSLGDAFRNIRARNGSVSQNAHEIAHALRAPLSPKLVVCNPSPPVPMYPSIQDDILIGFRTIDPLHRLVCIFSAHKYLLQIHP